MTGLGRGPGSPILRGYLRNFVFMITQPLFACRLIIRCLARVDLPSSCGHCWWCLFACLFACLLVRFLVRSFERSFVCLPVRPSACLLVSVVICSLVRLFLRSLCRLLVRVIVCLLACLSLVFASCLFVGFFDYCLVS